MSRNVSTCRSGRTSRWVSEMGLMSRIATNPSAACTWSPSATSRQNRQFSGCDGKDPLLGDSDCAGFQKLSDVAVDEPRRVVVAVPTTGPIDEHAIGRPDPRLPVTEREIVRERAEPRTALLLHVRRNVVLARRDRPGARRVREDVDAAEPGAFDDVEGSLERRIALAGEADDHVGGQVEVVERLKLREVLGRRVAPTH